MKGDLRTDLRTGLHAPGPVRDRWWRVAFPIGLPGSTPSAPAGRAGRCCRGMNTIGHGHHAQGDLGQSSGPGLRVPAIVAGCKRHNGDSRFAAISVHAEAARDPIV